MLGLALLAGLLQGIISGPPAGPDQPRLILASVHVGARGPGHLSRTGATVGSAPACDAGTLDASQTCASALIVTTLF